MEKQQKKIFYLIILILVFILISFIWSFISNNSDKLSKEDTQKQIELESKYSYLNINPNKYKSVNEYLESQKTVLEKTWIDYKNENFVVWIYDSNKILTWYMWIQYNKDFSKIWKIDKNEIIYQIADWIKNNWIFWWKKSNTWTKIIMDYERVHPQSELLKDFFSWKQNPYSFISDMKKNQDFKTLSNEDKEIYAYLNDFIWDYKESNLARKETDNKKEKIIIDWIIKDGEWNPVELTKVTLLNSLIYDS